MNSKARPVDGAALMMARVMGQQLEVIFFFQFTSFFTRYGMNRVKYLSDTVENSGQFYIVSA